MGTLIVGGAVVLLCSNTTVIKIIASVGTIMYICKIKQGKDIAIGGSIIYIVVNIVKGMI